MTRDHAAQIVQFPFYIPIALAALKVSVDFSDRFGTATILKTFPNQKFCPKMASYFNITDRGILFISYY